MLEKDNSELKSVRGEKKRGEYSKITIYPDSYI